jgi:hypothetical protein
MLTPKRVYHRDGTLPDRSDPLVIFVYGSNLQGIHGAGAAKVAVEQYGAVFGQGVGLIGQSYGIATRVKKGTIVSLPLETVKRHVSLFVDFTHSPLAQHYKFFVTGVGCGRAGFHESQIAPLFTEAINCSFPDTWEPYLEKSIG